MRLDYDQFSYSNEHTSQFGFNQFELKFIFIQQFFDGTSKVYLSKETKTYNVNRDSIITDLFSLILFIKYCPLETKIIAGGKKGNHVGNKYVNETKEEIEILDSTWFTTIIKSEGFRVGGHFRLQPFGPGLVMKKLIWIDPFDKTGYKREAKVLKS